ncbi:hypothetical protein SPBR_07956 [Sporothrix brasiliensis 5110]|uniref:Uncharacterized protein n=1 Tax=Sporothrix brasiliensis 5110 TaxID=1398154 RepID=A0A0C2IRQ1_9PEZI|nr:uncharacterized protein SPBR_07956 [Sporothrix brasiliensis 5110]KIH89560.1 hypothetical protein SPBR_07956 [Sporothrix brasiliensis 5110]
MQVLCRVESAEKHAHLQQSARCPGCPPWDPPHTALSSTRRGASTFRHFGESHQPRGVPPIVHRNIGDAALFSTTFAPMRNN